MTAPIKWGIISTGAIAKCFANALTQTDSGVAVAVGSRSQASADKFADQFDIPTRHASYEALLADPEVEAVYVATPHPWHPEWAIKAIEAGKHVLCEKPLAINHASAMAMIDTAVEHGLFFMEAFMYRLHPQTAKLIELIQSGAIGEVRMVKASFGFNAGDPRPGSRLFENNMGGGGILDVGAYTISMARLVAGAAAGQPFLNPTEIKAVGHTGETRVDEWAAAVLKFENNVVAQVETSIRAGLENTVVVTGSTGRLILPNPWQHGRGEAVDGLIIKETREGREEIKIPTDRNSFAYEADAVAAAIHAGRIEPSAPAATHADTLGSLAVLDEWRSQVGVIYDMEKPEHQPKLTVANRPLKKRDDAPMKYSTIPGLDKPVSRLIMGCDNQRTYAHAAVMWDDWIERGGNAFDTAYVYGGGLMERLLGQWIRARGVEDQIVLTVKGAHTPHCNPEALLREFDISTNDRMGIGRTDIYIMHRDNPEVPVGEFIDVMNELVAAGRVTIFGGSNWSIERFVEANEYAKANGKQGMSVMNNNLSLAEMVKPVWAGCIHVSAPESRAWLQETQTANFSWSSQARGYFTPPELRMRLGAGNFECWDSPDNQARRARAEELAEKKGVTAINIAAAYVLSQPFPSFALIGPRLMNETRTSMPALDIELTQAEIDWLWSGE